MPAEGSCGRDGYVVPNCGLSRQGGGKGRQERGGERRGKRGRRRGAKWGETREGETREMDE